METLFLFFFFYAVVMIALGIMYVVAEFVKLILDMSRGR